MHSFHSNYAENFTFSVFNYSILALITNQFHFSHTLILMLFFLYCSMSVSTFIFNDEFIPMSSVYISISPSIGKRGLEIRCNGTWSSIFVDIYDGCIGWYGSNHLASTNIIRWPHSNWQTFWGFRCLNNYPMSTSIAIEVS